MATANLTPAQANLIARQNLLSTGIPMVKRLSPVIGGVGDQLKIPLLRMGIMTGVLLQFSAPIADSGTSTAPTASPYGPWNLAQLITYNDFAGTQRTRTNGAQLYLGNSFRNRGALSAIPKQAGNTSTPPTLNYDDNILSIPTALGKTLYFSLFVPMAYDPANDLTGAVMTQTNVGEHYITVQLANSFVSADPWSAPFTAGSIDDAQKVTVEAFQFYIQPQSMNINALPAIDLSTVYGFEGNYQLSGNIASGQSTFVNLPNNRSILSTMVQYENNSTFTADGSDLNGIVLVANSNTNFREMSPRMLREMMRNMADFDAPAGTYYISSRRQPILTQLYANVQARMDVKTANAGITQMISQYEVMYPSGSPLPGVTVSA